MRAFRWAVLVMMAVVGCASQHKAEVRPLHAAAGTSAVVSQQLEQGNQLFAQQDWAGAQRCIWRRSRPTRRWRKPTIISR